MKNIASVFGFILFSMLFLNSCQKESLSESQAGIEHQAVIDRDGGKLGSTGSCGVCQRSLFIGPYALFWPAWIPCEFTATIQRKPCPDAEWITEYTFSTVGTSNVAIQQVIDVHHDSSYRILLTNENEDTFSFYSSMMTLDGEINEYWMFAITEGLAQGQTAKVPYIGGRGNKVDCGCAWINDCFNDIN